MNPTDVDPPLAATPAAEVEEAAAKPKRRRAPRKAADAAVAEGLAAGVADQPAVPDAAPPAASAEPAAQAAPDAAEPGDGAAPRADDDERGPRRGRNRRRGRRGGDKNRPEGTAAPVEAPQAGDVFAEVMTGTFDAERDAPAAEPAADDDAAAPAEMAAEAEPEAIEPGAEPAADATESSADEPAGAPRRVLAPDPDAPKLHKVLAQAGVGSRRDLEQWIGEGRVAVNGQVAHVGQRVSFGDRITLDGKPVRYRIAPPPPRVLAYHKPAGEVVTHDDPQQRPTVFRRLPRLQQGKWQSVGRLDINTEGLLLFTNSGELANQLMHPRFGVEREYAVRSLGLLGEEAKARLLEGVEIDGQRCGFKSIEDGGGEGANHWYRCVITEGRNREVRKLFEAVGHAVSRLIRIRYGSVVLPRGLKRGVWVDLGPDDLRALRRLMHAPRPADAPPLDGDGERGPGRNRNRNRRNRNKARGEGGGEAPMRLEQPPRAERGPRSERGDRADRGERGESRREGRGPAREVAGDAGEGGFIPNPLQQTFDKRAIQQARKPQRDIPEDGPIPSPLQQTYDKRALQRERAPQRDIPEDGPIPNPLQQTYDKRFVQGKRRGGGAAAADPDQIPNPLQTSMGFIGADAFHRKGAKSGKGGGGGRGKRPGGGGGGSGGGSGGGGGGGRNRKPGGPGR